MSANLTLKGLARDFSLQESAPLHLRIGNYVINSDINPVLSRDLRRKKLVLRLTETGNPDASIRVTLSHHKSRSLLNIDVKGKRLDLSRMTPTLLDTESSGSKTGTVPFVFFLGRDHSAGGDLKARVSANKRKIICKLLHGRKNKFGRRDN